jgi:hypothetical protein
VYLCKISAVRYAGRGLDWPGEAMPELVVLRARAGWAMAGSPGYGWAVRTIAWDRPRVNDSGLHRFHQAGDVPGAAVVAARGPCAYSR